MDGKEIELSKVSLKLSGDGQSCDRDIRIMKLFIVFYCIISKRSKQFYFLLFRNRLEHNKKHLKSLSLDLQEQLAESGLIAKPSEDGVVQCFVCGIELQDFTDNDNPIKCHAVFSPDCMYMETVYGRAFIKQCIAEFSGIEQMETDVTDPLHGLIQQLIQSINQFESSTQYLVAKELDYSDDRCISVFIQAFLRYHRRYKSAGDLVNDLEDATYPSPNAQPTLILKGTYGFYKSTTQYLSDMEKLRSERRSKKHLPTSENSMVTCNNEGEPVTAAVCENRQSDRGVQGTRSQTATNSQFDSSRRLQEETTRLYLSTRCKRCMKNPANHVILPCSELAICGSCLSVASSCPSCGGAIADSIQTFM